MSVPNVCSQFGECLNYNRFVIIFRCCWLYAPFFTNTCLYFHHYLNKISWAWYDLHMILSKWVIVPTDVFHPSLRFILYLSLILIHQGLKQLAIPSNSAILNLKRAIVIRKSDCRVFFKFSYFPKIRLDGISKKWKQWKKSGCIVLVYRMIIIVSKANNRSIKETSIFQLIISCLSFVFNLGTICIWWFIANDEWVSLKKLAI